jgi:hypothetical protein
MQPLCALCHIRPVYALRHPCSCTPRGSRLQTRLSVALPSHIALYLSGIQRLQQCSRCSAVTTLGEQQHEEQQQTLMQHCITACLGRLRWHACSSNRLLTTAPKRYLAVTGSISKTSSSNSSNGAPVCPKEPGPEDCCQVSSMTEKRAFELQPKVPMPILTAHAMSLNHIYHYYAVVDSWPSTT